MRAPDAAAELLDCCDDDLCRVVRRRGLVGSPQPANPQLVRGAHRTPDVRPDFYGLLAELVAVGDPDDRPGKSVVAHCLYDRLDDDARLAGTRGKGDEGTTVLVAREQPLDLIRDRPLKVVELRHLRRPADVEDRVSPGFAGAGERRRESQGSHERHGDGASRPAAGRLKAALLEPCFEGFEGADAVDCQGELSQRLVVQIILRLLDRAE